MWATISLTVNVRGMKKNEVKYNAGWIVVDAAAAAARGNSDSKRATKAERASGGS